jgi:hypothetical protein
LRISVDFLKPTHRSGIIKSIYVSLQIAKIGEAFKRPVVDCNARRHGEITAMKGRQVLALTDSHVYSNTKSQNPGDHTKTVLEKRRHLEA